MSFRESSSGYTETSAQPKFLHCCAKGCGCTKKVPSAVKWESWTCDFHRLADKRYWDKVTERLHKYSWMFKVEKQLVERVHAKTKKTLPYGWFDEVEIDEINALLESQGFHEMLISRELKKYGCLERRESPKEYLVKWLDFMNNVIVPPGFRKGAGYYSRSLDESIYRKDSEQSELDGWQTADSLFF